MNIGYDENCIDRYMCEVFFHRWCPVRVHPDVGLILRFLFVILGYCKASPFDCSYTYLVSQRERERVLLRLLLLVTVAGVCKDRL